MAVIVPTLFFNDCRDNLMAVIEFGSLFPHPLYNVDRSVLSTSLMGLSTLFGGSRGRIWVEEGFKLHARYCLKKHGLKLVLAVRKTKTKMDRASQLIFCQ